VAFTWYVSLFPSSLWQSLRRIKGERGSIVLSIGLVLHSTTTIGVTY
jgi:Na+-transporting NADH:ubiquinone oxidoreductase subunit NqrB